MLRRPASAPSGRRFGRLDLFDLGVLVALGLLSAWILGWALERADASHVWIGVDSIHIADPMQYLAWIREASHGSLIANPYTLGPTAASFLHPGFLVSGLLVALGMSPSLSLLLWKPVAVVALFVAVRAYVHRSLPGTVSRRSALVLALFCAPLADWIAHLGSTSSSADLVIRGLSFDMWPGSWLWGYPFTVLAVASLTGGLLAYARDRDDGVARPWAPLLALLCSWLQPWQGATFLMVVVAAEAIARLGGERRARLRGLAQPAVTVAAGAAPLVYYAALARWDPSWATARTETCPRPRPGGPYSR